MKLTNEQKALIYDDLVRESDRLQREMSKIRSEYPINVPAPQQQKLNENQGKIDFLVKRLEGLYD